MAIFASEFDLLFYKEKLMRLSFKHHISDIKRVLNINKKNIVQNPLIFYLIIIMDIKELNKSIISS